MNIFDCDGLQVDINSDEHGDQFVVIRRSLQSVQLSTGEVVGIIRSAIPAIRLTLLEWAHLHELFGLVGKAVKSEKTKETKP